MSEEYASESREVQDESFVEEFVKPSLKIGALGGTFGLTLGTISGTLRSQTPRLFAIASGIQCFALGSTYWASRTAFLHYKVFHPSTTPDATPSTYVNASTAAGGLTGSSLGLLFRGPRNVIPGAIMFSLFGFSGQHLYNLLDARHTYNFEETRERLKRQGEGAEAGLGDVDHSVWRRAVDWIADPKRKWSPIRKLSDKEYEDILQEKLIAVEADLAMLDEEIERVRNEQNRERQERPRGEGEGEGD